MAATSIRSHLVLLLLLSTTVTLPVSGQELAASGPYPTALLTFQERGQEVAGLGAKVTDLLYANLAAQKTLMLVDRETLEAALDEQELTLSGVVSADEAVQVGKLTGAKLLISGSILDSNSKLILVAKALGVETSRLAAVTVKGSKDDDLDDLVSRLATAIADEVAKTDQLVAAAKPHQAQIAQLRKALAGKKLPVISINVPERHVGVTTSDPAAETEFLLICRDGGFEVMERPANCDVLIEGEGLSEFAGRYSNLISVRARVEVKAVERRTGRVLAADRQTAIALGTSEQLAGKSALEEAARQIAGRMLPKVQRAWSPDKQAD